MADEQATKYCEREAVSSLLILLLFLWELYQSKTNEGAGEKESWCWRDFTSHWMWTLSMYNTIIAIRCNKCFNFIHIFRIRKEKKILANWNWTNSLFLCETSTFIIIITINLSQLFRRHNLQRTCTHIADRNVSHEHMDDVDEDEGVCDSDKMV